MIVEIQRTKHNASITRPNIPKISIIITINWNNLYFPSTFAIKTKRYVNKINEHTELKNYSFYVYVMPFKDAKKDRVEILKNITM